MMRERYRRLTVLAITVALTSAIGALSRRTLAQGGSEHTAAPSTNGTAREAIVGEAVSTKRASSTSPAKETPDSRTSRASMTTSETELRRAPPARCAGSLRLVGSVVNTTRPERSLAALRVGSGTHLVRVGSNIGALTLVALRPTRAYLQQADGAVCELRVSPNMSAPAVASEKPKAKKKKKKSKRTRFDAAELNAGVRQIGPQTFVVSRGLLKKALGSPRALRRSARFRPKKENGRTTGLELLRIRKNSPLKHLGLQKGDVLQKLNGHPLGTPDGALQALSVMKTQGRFSLAVSRGGSAQTLSYIVN